MDNFSGIAARPFFIEALETRQLLSAFHINLSAPPTVNLGQQFPVELWASGGTVNSNGYTVTLGDGSAPIQVPAQSGVTTAELMYNTATGPYTISASATSTGGVNASATYGMEYAGNYPAANAGPTVYLPNTSPQNSTASNGYAVAVDSGTGIAYLAESYTPTTGGVEMAVTRLTSANTPDTAFGQISNSTRTGTFVVPSFGGGSDTPYAAAVLDANGVDELALAGKSAHGFAVAIIDISTVGSLIGTSDYGAQTMPSGQANAVIFDSNNDAVAAGQSGGQMTAVALLGTGTSVGEKDSNFGNNGVTSITFPQSSTGSDAISLMQEPAGGYGNGDLVLGGWSSFCNPLGCAAWCDMAVAGLVDSVGGAHGGIDTSNFGVNGRCMVSVACAALGNGFNGCRGSAGVSQDSVYSLVWDDDVYDDSNGQGGLSEIAAIGGTNYSGANQFALWLLTPKGAEDTSFGPYGVEVPNVNATARGGTVDNSEILPGTTTTNPTDGFLYAVGISSSNDMIVARISMAGGTAGELDTGSAFPNDLGFGTNNQGYYTLDLGNSSGNSIDVATSVAVENDLSPIIAGYTGPTSSGGQVAAVRYFQFTQIVVASGGGAAPLAAKSPPQLETAAVVVAPTPPQLTPFSSGPPLSGAPASDSDPLAKLLAPLRRRRHGIAAPGAANGPFRQIA